MPSECVIAVNNVTKTYRIFNHPGDRIKQSLMFGLKNFHAKFTALNDVTFEVNKGESVGVIGRNGAGKSTLLQLICGILKPTSGNVLVRGRVSALLELGSGFNPEFTGRENVYFQGAISGVSRQEMARRFDEIAAFADIGDFIDQPVRTYSSGMFVRLAFAVVAHVDADILLIDEALAVGDVLFQQKCMRFLRTFKDKGGTILFVSHDTSAVIGLCDKAILLPSIRGTQLHIGSAKAVCQTYYEQMYATREEVSAADETNKFQEGEIDSNRKHATQIDANHRLVGDEQPANRITATKFRRDAESFGCGGVAILDAWFESARARTLYLIGGSNVELCIKAKALKNVKWPAFGFMIKNHLGQYVFAEGTDFAFRQHNLTFYNDETWTIRYSFLMPILIQGNYSINVAVAEGLGEDHIQHHWIEDVITLQSVQSRLVHGVCGLQNMSIAIERLIVDRSIQ